VFRERHAADSARITTSRLQIHTEIAIFRGFFMDLDHRCLEKYFTRVKYAGALRRCCRQYFTLDLGIIAGAMGAKAIVERYFPAGQNRVL
jgi:hypothetical protein